MLYSRELIGLMEPFPGRAFLMRQLVGYVLQNRRNDPKAKEAARKAVRRVLLELHECGFVIVTEPACRRASATYAWIRVGHEGSKSRTQSGTLTAG